MAPQNTERRRALADAAIDLLGREGVHGLTHRNVDERAGLPSGTASNYFRSRDALLVAAMERIAGLHRADMEAGSLVTAPIGRAELVGIIGASLLYSATEQRVRYLAVYELTLEATRRPALREVLTRMHEAAVTMTVGLHRRLGLDTSPDDVANLIVLYGSTLFGLLTGPSDRLTAETAATLANAIVTGVLGPAVRVGDGVS
ncbi:TetR family transcriptional regulator [Spirillospora sp. NPDC052269]